MQMTTMRDVHSVTNLRWEDHPELTSEGEGDNEDDNGDDSDSYGSIGCGQYDILCGKDKTYATHLGNRIFRAAIVAFRDLYSAARCKQDKMTITRAVVHRLRQQYGSRFVRFYDGQWEEISDVMARDKVSHALRFSLREGSGASLGAGAGRNSPKAVRKLPDRTFSLQLVDPAIRLSAAATTATTTTTAESSSSSSNTGRRAMSLPASAALSAQGLEGDTKYDASLYENDNDGDDEAETEKEAAEALRRCQLLIFQSLRFDDPLEDGLDHSLRTISFVRQTAAV
jgi:hypothetical protein